MACTNIPSRVCGKVGCGVAAATRRGAKENPRFVWSRIPNRSRSEPRQGNQQNRGCLWTSPLACVRRSRRRAHSEYYVTSESAQVGQGTPGGLHRSLSLLKPGRCLAGVTIFDSWPPLVGSLALLALQVPWGVTRDLPPPMGRGVLPSLAFGAQRGSRRRRDPPHRRFRPLRRSRVALR